MNSIGLQTSRPCPAMIGKNRRFSSSRNSRLVGLSLVLYTTGVTIGYQFSLVFLILGYVGVAGMILLSLHEWTRGRHPVVPEVLLLACFAAWAAVTGLPFAVDYDLFVDGLVRLLQILVVAGCVAGATARLRSPAIGFAAVLGVALLLGAYGILTGDFAGATELTERGGQLVGERASSMAHNPNTLGVGAVWGLAAVTFFASLVRRKWLKAVLWATTPLLAISMVASASRKALVLPIVFLAAWLWFCHRKWLFRRWQSALALGALIALLAWGLPWVMEYTVAGQRAQEIISPEGEFFESSARIGMYRSALSVIGERPLFGVGLSQWRFYGAGGYAHADYTEVAATTGLLGLALYLTPYLLAFRRLRRIYRAAPSERERYKAGVSQAVMVTVAAAAFGQVLFSSLAYWSLMAALWGFAFGGERALAAEGRLGAVRRRFQHGEASPLVRARVDQRVSSHVAGVAGIRS